jgi:hypothetical protein
VKSKSCVNARPGQEWAANEIRMTWTLGGQTSRGCRSRTSTSPRGRGRAACNGWRKRWLDEKTEARTANPRRFRARTANGQGGLRIPSLGGACRKLNGEAPCQWTSHLATALYVPERQKGFCCTCRRVQRCTLCWNGSTSPIPKEFCLPVSLDHSKPRANHARKRKKRE